MQVGPSPKGGGAKPARPDLNPLLVNSNTILVTNNKHSCIDERRGTRVGLVLCSIIQDNSKYRDGCKLSSLPTVVRSVQSATVALIPDRPIVR